MEMIYRWRVRMIPLLAILVIFLAKPALFPFLTGLGLCLLGLMFRMWAAGHIRKEKELTVSGPYKYTRNPLYLGNLILGISIVVGTYSWWCLLIFVVYFLLFYPPVMREERERMKCLFPEKYDEYKKRVPLFFPSLKPSVSSKKIKFSLPLYKKNREYRALIGASIFWFILGLKMIFFP